MKNSILFKDFEELINRDIPFNEFKNTKILITGATGLIGSLIIKFLLYANYKMNLNVSIFAIIRNEEKAKQMFSDCYNINDLHFITADLLYDDILIDENIDFVIHAAAITTSKLMISNPVETIQTSINGTVKVLDLAISKKVKSFVYLSSMEVYGQPQNKNYVSEKDLGYIDIENIRSCYPESKRMCECLIHAYSSQYSLDGKIIRLAQTFGAGISKQERRVFAQFANSSIRNEDIILQTNGNSEGNYVYTIDAIDAILRVLLNGQRDSVYNVSNEQSHATIRDMAKLVAEDISENKIKVVINIPDNSEKLGYAPEVHMKLDASKVKELGWKPVVSLYDSYDRLIKWMKEIDY